MTPALHIFILLPEQYVKDAIITEPKPYTSTYFRAFVLLATPHIHVINAYFYL